MEIRKREKREQEGKFIKLDKDWDLVNDNWEIIYVFYF